MRRSLAEIVRAFGVEPDAIRRISHRQNTHWKVRAGAHGYVLRRCGAWLDVEGDLDWELAVVKQWAAAGLSVPRPLGPPQAIDGATWFLMPWLEGRPLARSSCSDAQYEQLGGYLAEVHAASAALPPPPSQRPGWTSYVDAAFPLVGGAARRGELLAELAKVDAGVSARFQAAAEALEARELPKLFASHPRRTIHADFAPWNIRLTGGRLTGFFDFELAHVDVLIGDIAQSRRGFHDGVVRGYLRRGSLSELELANVDAFWLAAVMMGVWRELEMRVAKGPITAVGLEWTLAQLDKVRPYQG